MKSFSKDGFMFFHLIVIQTIKIDNKKMLHLFWNSNKTMRKRVIKLKINLKTIPIYAFN